MLTSRVIACLDCRDGRVVKGVRFQALVDCGDPVELALRYEEEGADEIVLLDVTAGPERRRTAIETVRRVRERLSIPLTVGGGIRSVADAALVLDAGADRVSVNAAAIATPALLTAIADRFGSQATIVAIDAKRTREGYEAYVQGGRQPTGLEALSWAAEAARRGAGEVLLTSIDRDGTGDGYDTELIARMRAAVDLPLIASGGARTADDLVAALAAGADAVLVAGILHRGDTTIVTLKETLRAAGASIRPC